MYTLPTFGLVDGQLRQRTLRRGQCLSRVKKYVQMVISNI